MNSEQFIKGVHVFFTKWLNNVNIAIKNGQIRISGKYSFTNILRVAESTNHYICELYGSKEYPLGQRISLDIPTKTEKVVNTTSYFVPGTNINDSMTAPCTMFSSGSAAINARLATKFDFDTVNKALNLPKFVPNLSWDVAEIPLAVLPRTNYAYLVNVELIRTDNLKIFYRTIPSAFIVQKSVADAGLYDWLNKTCSDLVQRGIIIGINPIADAPIEHFSNQLLSLANQSVNESYIDNFLLENSDYFANALGYQRALSQKVLSWLERTDIDPYESKPDYLMERKDGYFDILDLKKGVIPYSSVTKHIKSGKDGKARISFNSYVTDLIAQLQDYERFFRYEENSKWALKEYRIKVKNPRLIGIVGNYNNFDNDEVKYAIEPYRDKIKIISYIGLVNFLKLQVL